MNRLNKVLVFVFMVLSVSAQAQIKLLSEVKVSDSVMYFDGNKVDLNTTANSTTGYDYVYGTALTPHGDCIKTYKHYVFMTWYRGGKLDRHVMLTRYNTKTGISKTIEFPHQHTGYNGKWWIGETHNTISVGICPKDSTIHMLYDMHRNGNVPAFVNDYLRYSYTEKGGATVADDDFTIDRFVNSTAGNYKHLSFDGIDNVTVTKLLTYPDFFTNDEGDLFMKNRFGYSANGRFLFARYDGEKWKGYTDFNRSNAANYDSEYNWGLYGEIKYLNGKIRVGFQRRSVNKNDKFLYQNGIYYAYSDDPAGVSQWKDHKGKGFIRPISNADLIKIEEPGDFVATTQKDKVYIVGGFDFTITNNEDVHFVSQVKDNENNVTKKLHTYKKAGDADFTTVEYSAGSALYAAGNDVYVIGLTGNRVNISKTVGGTNDFKQIYQHTAGPLFDKGVVNVYDGKLYYYLKEKGGSGDKRTTYLQVFDLDIDTTPVDTSRLLAFKNIYNYQQVEVGSDLSIEASVGSAYKEVALWSGTTNLGTLTNAPYVWSGHSILTDMTEASYTFKLVAKDSSNVEVEKTVTINTMVPSANAFTGEGQYTIYNPSKSKWMGYDSATDDALVTSDGEGDINMFNVVANGDKFNIYTGDNKKVVVINSAEGFTSMLATPTPEVLASGDARFSFDETSTGSELYYLSSGVVDANSGKNFTLNVKSNGSDIGRGTSGIANYQWQITRIGDIVTSGKEISLPKVSVSIYPNPTKGMIYFDGLSVQQVKIYTLSGQLMKDSNLRTSQVDVSQLSNGIYLLQLVDIDGKLYHQKIVIE